jgi:hypothetical protein
MSSGRIVHLTIRIFLNDHKKSDENNFGSLDEKLTKKYIVPKTGYDYLEVVPICQSKLQLRKKVRVHGL